MQNRKQYTDEFKEQILKECQETGNVALVARRHEIPQHHPYMAQCCPQKRFY